MPGSPSTTVLRAADAAVRSALAAVRQARESPASPASGRSRPGPGIRAAARRGGRRRQHPVQGSSRPARRRLLRLGTTSMTTPTGRPVGTGVISRRAGPSASSTRSCHGRAPVPTSIALIVTWSWSPGGRARAARLAMTMSSVTASTGPRARAHVARNAAMTRRTPAPPRSRRTSSMSVAACWARKRMRSFASARRHVTSRIPASAPSGPRTGAPAHAKACSRSLKCSAPTTRAGVAPSRDVPTPLVPANSSA